MPRTVSAFVTYCCQSASRSKHSPVAWRWCSGCTHPGGSGTAPVWIIDQAPTNPTVRPRNERGHSPGAASWRCVSRPHPPAYVPGAHSTKQVYPTACRSVGWSACSGQGGPASVGEKSRCFEAFLRSRLAAGSTVTPAFLLPFLHPTRKSLDPVPSYYLPLPVMSKETKKVAPSTHLLAGGIAGLSEALTCHRTSLLPPPPNPFAHRCLRFLSPSDRSRRGTEETD